MEGAESDSHSEANAETWEKDANDSDSDFEMQGQALPVAPFDIDEVDTAAVPQTSQEYLQQVIAERAKLPRIVTATVPKLEPSSQKSNLCIFPDEEIVDSPHKPSEQWQEEQVYHFSNLRYKIECNKESWTGTCLLNLPNTQSGWFKFLFEEKSSSTTVDLLQQPYLDIVLQMNYETTENVVKYLIDWVSEEKISVYTAGMWLFALLACIEVPDFSIAENKPELAALNLFVCLIGKYFGQRDLAD